MSDVYKGKELISLTECPNTKLHYILEQRKSGNEVVFWLKIKMEALVSWRRSMVCSSQSLKYIELMNLSIPGDAFRLNKESVRLEKQFSRIATDSENKRKALNKMGNLKKRKEFLESWKKVAILKDDIITVEQWESELSDLEQQLKTAESQIEELKEKYSDIEKEKQELFLEMLKEKEAHNIYQEENEKMKKYIRQLEKDQYCQVRGTAIPKLKSTQAKNKKLKELKSRAQKALHFSSLFGLEIDCLKLKDPDSSKTYNIEFNSSSPTEPLVSSASPNASSTQDKTLPATPPSSSETSSTSSSPNMNDQSSPQTQFSKLNEDNKARVESILYLLDKFGVGDELLHELSMTIDGLPKSYLIKQCRSELNKNCIITSTPGKAPGAQHHFKQLLTDQVKQMVCTYLNLVFIFRL